MSFIECRIKGVKVFRVQVILRDPQRLAETLEVDDLAFPQELDRIAYVGIVGKPQDIVICRAGFLFSGKILNEVCYRVSFGLEICCCERRSRRCYRIDSRSMVDKIGVKAACLYLFHCKVSGELIKDRGYHFEVRQFICTLTIEITFL